MRTAEKDSTFHFWSWEGRQGRGGHGARGGRGIGTGLVYSPDYLKLLAVRSIDFLTFIYWQGDVAERFGEALASRRAIKSPSPFPSSSRGVSIATINSHTPNL